MWWLGFRQVKSKTSSGSVIHQPGSAVVCGPYKTEADANKERFRRVSVEWDATYSYPFEGETEKIAQTLVESLTPME